MSTEIVYKKDVLDLLSMMPTEEGITRALLTQSVKQLPSAEPVICCRDCKHYVDGWIHCNRVTWWNGADDFCSRAERRQDETDRR